MCVGIVSDSTLISMPANGAAASTNHCISATCSSRLIAEGWNSSSIHFSAAAMSAKAAGAPAMSAIAAAADHRGLRISLLPRTRVPVGRHHASVVHLKTVNAVK